MQRTRSSTRPSPARRAVAASASSAAACHRARAAVRSSALEIHDHGRVIAAAEFAQNTAFRGGFFELPRVEDVVESPADVFLARLSPVRPPGEEMLVFGLEGASHVVQTSVPDSLLQPTPF